MSCQGYCYLKLYFGTNTLFILCKMWGWDDLTAVALMHHKNVL